jgi:nucleotide-binding universal stress UspA family protein
MLHAMTKTIVVGYDGKEPAEHALERALQEAKAAHARLLIVTVEDMPLDPYEPPTFGTLDDSPPAEPPVAEPPEQLQPVTARALSRAEAEGVPADYLWAVGDPARTIVDAARDNSASTIIVGSHHHSLLQRLLGQDVAAAVQHEANCDVIVVD